MFGLAIGYVLYLSYRPGNAICHAMPLPFLILIVVMLLVACWGALSERGVRKKDRVITLLRRGGVTPAAGSRS